MKLSDMHSIKTSGEGEEGFLPFPYCVLKKNEYTYEVWQSYLFFFLEEDSFWLL